ncbi:MAG: PH domain-containing protein [Clostridia bacterium]|nr:PH domain-containing protein [Clostridia bacterium]
MKFRSKISSGMLLLTLIFMFCTLGTFLVWAIVGTFIPSAVFVGLDILIILPIYINTKYKVQNGYLYISFGYFMINHAIPCYDIISMIDVYSNSPAPALSGERLRIKYVKNGKIKTISISPADKQQFRACVQNEILQNSKKAQVSRDQIDLNVLQNVLDKESKVQNKMDNEAFFEQQKQIERDLKENAKDMQYLEKRMQKAQILQYAQEQKQAIKEANEQLSHKDLLHQLEDGKANFQRKQLAALIALQDQKEKEERKKENKLWAKNKKEKQLIQEKPTATPQDELIKETNKSKETKKPSKLPYGREQQLKKQLGLDKSSLFEKTQKDK